MEDKKIEKEAIAQTEVALEEEMKLENKPTETDKKPEAKDSDTDYFVYINRFVTSALSSFISVSLIFASGFIVNQIFGNGALDEVEIKSALLFTLFSVLALFLGQFLQNYFVKIIEKEAYGFVLGKSFKNLIWQIVLLACFIPVFISSSYVSPNSLLMAVIIFSFANNLLAVSIRESEHAVRQQASIVGMFFATGLWAAFVSNLYADQVGSWTFALLMIIPLQAVCAELFVMIADGTSKYFK